MNDLNTLFPRALKAINEIIEHEYNISRKNYRQTRHSTLVSKVLCHSLLRSDSSYTKDSGFLHSSYAAYYLLAALERELESTENKIENTWFHHYDGYDNSIFKNRIT
jgi:hypothetical protein